MKSSKAERAAARRAAAAHETEAAEQPKVKKTKPTPPEVPAAPKVKKPPKVAPRTETHRIPVVVNQAGYYDLKLHKPGERFTYKLKPHEKELPHWVNAVEAEHKHLESVDTTKDYVPVAIADVPVSKSPIHEPEADEEDEEDEDVI